MKCDNDLINEFVVESKEHLSTIEEDLLGLEKAAGAPRQELIDKVFRAIHSIKGAAGFLGLRKINDLSHVMETLLQMIRSGETKPTPKMVDALLAGVDTLSAMLDNVSESESVDIQKAHDRLSSLLAKQVSSKAKKQMSSSVRILDASGADTGFSLSEFALRSRPKTHEFLYILKYDLSEMRRKGGMSPVVLVRELLSTGEILLASLKTPAKSLSEDLSQSPLDYEVIYSTVLDPDFIADAARLPEERIIRAFPEGSAAPAHEKAAEPQKETQPQTQEAQEPVRQEEEESAQAVQAKSSSDHPDTIRINLAILDKLMTLAGELVLVRNQHLMHFSERGDSASSGISQRLDIVTTELQETIMRTRMQPVGNIFGKLPRIVRDLSAKLGKKMEITVSGEEVELDKTILESLSDPLTHLVRNCCDHGVETPEIRVKAGKREAGRINVKAYHEGGQINIEVSDDGKGIDPASIKAKALQLGLASKEQLAQMSDKEAVSLIMRPGFSTADKVTDVSGRGVGMDVVQRAIEKMGGTLDISSKPGEGSCILMRMPLTLAIIPCLIVVAGGHRYAIPQVNLEELVCLYDDDIRTKIECENNQEVYRLRHKLLPMVRLDEVFLRPDPFTPAVKGEITERRRQDCEQRSAGGSLRETLTFAVVKVGSERFGLIVDKVLGTEEIVVKPMHSALKSLKIYSGATVMGDGRCALILDIEGLAKHAGLEFCEGSGEASGEKTASAKRQEETQAVLLFRNGPDEQFAIPLPLIKRIERVEKKRMEKVGEKEFIAIENVPTRIVRMDKVLNVSGCEDREEMFLILPKHSSKPFGALVSALVDITEAPLELNGSSVMEDGILGTSMIRGRMTLFPDIYRLIERLEPEWFHDGEQEPKDRKRKILLVEDAPFFRQLVKGYLESDGYTVATAVNGKGALERLESESFDLVVSDIEMPEMDGWELAKALKADSRTSSLPIIALTALDAEKDQQRAKEAGFDKYQVKIDREELLKTVAESLRQAKEGKKCEANA